MRCGGELERVGERAERAQGLGALLGGSGAGATPGRPRSYCADTKGVEACEALGSKPCGCWARLVFSPGGTVTRANACSVLPNRGTWGLGARTWGSG